MANQEGVEIIIKATDQYTSTIKKIEASNQLFGQSVKNIEKEIAALENYMIKLVANGVKPTSASIKLLQMNLQALNGTLNATQNAALAAEGAIGSSAANLKKSNQQWTNLALVVQDLPYGFRGIQNNLPALIGGMAGVGGAAYFAFSSVIAILTAVDSGIISFGKSLKLTTDFAKEAGTAYANEIVKLNGLYNAATNVNIAMNDRIAAANTLKELYPGLLEQYSAEEITLGKADTAFKKLTTTLWAYAKAKAAQTTLEEIAGKQNTLIVERADLLDEFTKNNINNFSKEADYTADGIRLMSDYDKELDRRTRLLRKNATAYNDLEKAAGKYVKIQESNINAESQIDKFKEDPTKTDAAKEAAKEIAKTNAANAALNKKNVQQKIKDINLITEAESAAALSLLSDKDKELRILTKEYIAKVNLAVKYGQDTSILEMAHQGQLAEIRKKYDDKELKEITDKEDKVKKIITDNRDYIKNAINKINTDFANQNIKNVKAELSSTLKATRGNYEAQKAAYQLSIDKLNGFIETEKEAGRSTNELQAAVIELQNSMSGLVDPIENFGIQFNDIMKNLQTNVLVEVGTQLGNIFSGVEVDTKSFFNFIADTLIQLGTQLIILSKLFLTIQALFASGGALAPFAIPVGIAAIAAGTALKNMVSDKASKFANGGIVSGPTMGLVGEYPGASSNPEVIAPLDKLKSMIGESGGGGTFVLRGQDLLLSVQKAQKSSKLKGQNINLA